MIFTMNKKYKLSDFDYNLPKELIAQKPVTPRDHSRLLLLKKESGEIIHKHFYDLPSYLKKGDVLVMNNSKVFPARLIGKKKTGGKMEVFLHRYLSSRGSASFREAESLNCNWQCLIGGRGARAGLEIFFSEKLKCKVLKNNNDGTWEIEFNMNYGEMMKVVKKRVFLVFVGFANFGLRLNQSWCDTKNTIRCFHNVPSKWYRLVVAPGNVIPLLGSLFSLTQEKNTFRDNRNLAPLLNLKLLHPSPAYLQT